MCIYFPEIWEGSDKLQHWYAIVYHAIRVLMQTAHGIMCCVNFTSSQCKVTHQEVGDDPFKTEFYSFLIRNRHMKSFGSKSDGVTDLYNVRGVGQL